MKKCAFAVFAFLLFSGVLHAQSLEQPQGTPHHTALTWTAGAPVAGVTIAGYNVYKSSASGGESGTAAINGTALVTGLTYMDTNVTAGATAYYVVEEQSSTGNQSAPSNEVSATTPNNPPPPALNITQTAEVINGNSATITGYWTDSASNGDFYAIFGDGRVLTWGANLFHVAWEGPTPKNPWIAVCDAAGNCASAQPHP